MEKYKEIKKTVAGEKEKMTEENKGKGTNPKSYEIHRWHGFAGGVYLLKVEIGSLEEIEEIAEMMDRPLLWDEDKKRYKVLDGATAYIYQVED